MPTPRPSHRLRKHADYQRVYKTGRKQFRGSIGYFFVLRPPDSEEQRRSSTPGPRVGLTVPKALGKAVDRNRIKRRLREAVRAQLSLLTAPVDLVVHPRRSALTMAFPTLNSELAAIFRAVQKAAAQNAATQNGATQNAARRDPPTQEPNPRPNPRPNPAS